MLPHFKICNLLHQHSKDCLVYPGKQAVVQDRNIFKGGGQKWLRLAVPNN